MYEIIPIRYNALMLRRLIFFVLMIVGYHMTFLIPSSVHAQDSIIVTALKSRPAIVGVMAAKRSVIASPMVESRSSLLPFLQPSSNVRLKIARPEKKGAGVIIDRHGIIATNFHIIDGAEHIDVMMHDGTTIAARVLNLMPEHDLALIKIDSPVSLTPIAFADTSKITLGDEVINIGHSPLLHETISSGVITGWAVSRMDHDITFIKVNIGLYEGDSGGPLFDRRGRLLGMIAARFRENPSSSIAISADKIKKLYLQSIPKGYN